jgi:hypothetical protein
MTDPLPPVHAAAAPAGDVLTRRAWLVRAVPALGLLTFAAAAHAAPSRTPAPLLTVYKDPDCGCCEKWLTHMASAGFRPAVQDVADLAAVKARLGVPAALHACHTAVVGGYVVEGHVPAADVHRFLRERPRVGGVPARGLAVPAMPAGSPGMEGPRAERYAVLAFAPNGATARFAVHP